MAVEKKVAVEKMPTQPGTCRVLTELILHSWSVITGNLQVMSDNSPTEMRKQNPKRIKEILFLKEVPGSKDQLTFYLFLKIIRNKQKNFFEQRDC